MSDSSDIEAVLAPYFSVEAVITQTVSTMSVMLFVYGVYILLFGICVHMHLGKDAKDRPNRFLYLAWTIILFVLATLANIFEAWDYIHAAIVSFVAARTKEYEPFIEYATSYQLKTVRNSIIVLLALLINIAADSMLIHRCYIIWGSLRRVAFPLIFGSFVVNALGIASIVMMTKGQLDTSIESNLALLDKGITLNNGYLIGNAAFNGVLTLLTAGRIWWITREARQLMGQGIDHKYKTIVAIILESGILYPTAIVIYLIIANTLYYTNTAGILPIDFYPVVWQAAGIAPTLIIVRAGSGKTVETVDQVVSTLHFAEAPRGRVTDPGMEAEASDRDLLDSAEKV